LKADVPKDERDYETCDDVPSEFELFTSLELHLPSLPTTHYKSVQYTPHCKFSSVSMHY